MSEIMAFTKGGKKGRRKSEDVKIKISRPEQVKEVVAEEKVDHKPAEPEETEDFEVIKQSDLIQNDISSDIVIIDTPESINNVNVTAFNTVTNEDSKVTARTDTNHVEEIRYRPVQNEHDMKEVGADDRRKVFTFMILDTNRFYYVKKKSIK